MEHKKRLIDAVAIEAKIEKNFRKLVASQSKPDLAAALSYVGDLIIEAPTVDAVEVVHGHWKEYSHSALVRWKDGEPVWADRSVFRCSRCDFGTIAKHNYCPRCGAKMDGGKDNEI